MSVKKLKWARPGMSDKLQSVLNSMHEFICFQYEFSIVLERLDDPANIKSFNNIISIHSTEFRTLLKR